jgi:hypothetical protein
MALCRGCEVIGCSERVVFGRGLWRAGVRLWRGPNRLASARISHH